jgi:uncharacterized protein (TIGR03435 family)
LAVSAREQSLLIGITILGASAIQAQTAAVRPEFEVASIKQNAGGGERSFIGSSSPGTLSAENVPLELFIQLAYSVRPFQILGAPDWAKSERYDLKAKARVDAAPGPVNRDSMQKSMAEMLVMLQTLLEDRFKLKLHRETRELPVYFLTVAKGGLKLHEGECITFDRDHPPPAPTPGAARPAFCGNIGIRMNGANRVLEAFGTTMKDLTGMTLANMVGRTIIDKTGYTGKFDAHLAFAPDSAGGPLGPGAPDDPGRPAPSDTTGPSIFSALQEQLGLKLEAGKGPVEVLVIDHVEKLEKN